MLSLWFIISESLQLKFHSKQATKRMATTDTSDNHHAEWPLSVLCYFPCIISVTYILWLYEEAHCITTLLVSYQSIRFCNLITCCVCKYLDLKSNYSIVQQLYLTIVKFKQHTIGGPPKTSHDHKLFQGRFICILFAQPNITFNVSIGVLGPDHAQQYNKHFQKRSQHVYWGREKNLSL